MSSIRIKIITKKCVKCIFHLLIGGLLGAETIYLYILRNIFITPPDFWLSAVIITISIVLCIQGIFTLMWMLYTWENPLKAKDYQSPSVYLPSKITFTALIPARNEEKVIGDTIKAVSDIDYPEELKEVIILCRNDDENTITTVNKAINSIGKKNIRLVIYDDLPINKPHCLNVGLANSKKQVVTVFDAEDQPHQDIYNIVNTLMTSEQVDVVQSGVQLMNYRSHWFSSINVLEYFFWFKSGLHFFSRIGNVTPLGGNTVFFKKECLQKVNGWDEKCLTEDTDIGFRLVSSGAKTRIVYDVQHVTKEETPDSMGAFIKQRTRWNHGYLQIIFKGDWMRLPSFRQKIVALYILVAPMLQVAYLFYLPFGIWIATQGKLPVLVSMFSFIPSYIFILQITVYFVGIREFVKTYKLKYSIWDSLKIVFMFFPYQIMLTISSFRAILRLLFNQNVWEKTKHVNAHREISTGLLFPNIVSNYVE
jgi:glycosyltransferase XagB